MKYIYNFLWFLVGLASFGVGFILFIPAILLLTLVKIVSAAVITSLFTGMLIFTKLFGGNAEQLRHVRESGKSCINKL